MQGLRDFGTFLVSRAVSLIEAFQRLPSGVLFSFDLTALSVPVGDVGVDCLQLPRRAVIKERDDRVVQCLVSRAPTGELRVLPLERLGALFQEPDGDGGLVLVHQPAAERRPGGRVLSNSTATRG